LLLSQAGIFTQFADESAQNRFCVHFAFS
jgi:hypothetical protein